MRQRPESEARTSHSPGSRTGTGNDFGGHSESVTGMGSGTRSETKGHLCLLLDLEPDLKLSLS